jgi:hypothetical protein
VEGVKGDHAKYDQITWRGSVTDLATDCANLLTMEQGRELVAELERFLCDRDFMDKFCDGPPPLRDPMDLVLCKTYGCQNLKHRLAVFCGPCRAEYAEDPEAFK